MDDLVFLMVSGKRYAQQCEGCDRCVIFYFSYFYHSDILNTYVKCALIRHLSYLLI